KEQKRMMTPEMAKRREELLARQDTLPEKISDLLDLALNDLTYCEQHRDLYRVHMHFWHMAKDDESPRCQVCLAGAVIAKTLETLPEEEVRPNHFCKSINNKLSALDSLRQGHVMN